jgi:F-type H+-transporting ATPase subunit a
MIYAMASFAPEVFLEVGKFPVTNTVINTILVDGFLLLLALVTRSKLAIIPGKFQIVVEHVFTGIYGFVENIAGDKSKAVFPVFMTFFLLVIAGNYSGLIPGIGTFGIWRIEEGHGEIVKHLIPFSRPFTSDLNATFALAICSLVITNGYALYKLGIKEYLSKFFAFIPFFTSLLKGKISKPKFNNPLDLFISILTPLVMVFVGLLELLSEFVKAISLSFRLFGNIYAGEVVLETVQGIFAFLVPVPFLLLEFIVGAIQALVFAMLTMVFMIILSSSHHEDEAHIKEVSH